MNVFISWSSERSKYVAEALRPWLKQVINVLEPWISVADIEKGTRWRDHVATRLKASDFGIICLTPENLRSEWLLFEAGALSKAIDTAYVCPLLIGLEPSDITGPLAQFQAARANREDIWKLLVTINAALGGLQRPDQELEEAFEVWWPHLERKIKSIPAAVNEARPLRPDRELLEEILTTVRQQSQGVRPPPAPEQRDPSRESLNPFERDLQARLERLPGLYRAKVHAASDTFRVEIDPDPAIGRTMKRFSFPWSEQNPDSDSERAIEEVSAYLQELVAEREAEQHSYAVEDTPEISRFRAELLRELKRRNLRFSADVVERCRIADFDNHLVFSAPRLLQLSLKDASFKSVAEKVFNAMFKRIPEIEVNIITREDPDNS